MNIKENFGLKVKVIRQKKDISQEKLAELSGLHRTYISSIELGKRNISIVNIEKLSLALECKIIDLFIEE